MKELSNNLKESLNNDSINIVKCYNIVLNDGKNYHFTDNQTDICYDNKKYLSNNGFNLKTIYNNLSLEINETEINGFIDNEIINEKDVIAGRFDNAQIEIFLLDLNSREKISIFNGFITSISYENNIFIAKIEDKTVLLERTFCEVYSPLCRCSFCDSKCSLNKDNYTITGKISKVINQSEFYTSTQEIINKEQNYFSNGTIKIINGENKNFISEVKKFNNDQLLLKFKFPFEINVGDKFELTAGCDKEFNTCISKFNNAINFRGEPNLPRGKKIFKVY